MSGSVRVTLARGQSHVRDDLCKFMLNFYKGPGHSSRAALQAKFRWNSGADESPQRIPGHQTRVALLILCYKSGRNAAKFSYHACFGGCSVANCAANSLGVVRAAWWECGQNALLCIDGVLVLAVQPRAGVFCDERRDEPPPAGRTHSS